jgi:uncharacterized protein HemY
MDWIPVVFVIFKFLVLGTGMFYAIKWHYDQGKQGKQTERRAVMRAVGKAVAAFVVVLVVLGFVTFIVIRMFGMDLSLP